MGKAGLGESPATLCIQQEREILSLGDGVSKGSKSGRIMGSSGLSVDRCGGKV